MFDPATMARVSDTDELMDDLALVEALRSGDPRAPRLLVERFQGVVFALCLRMMGHRQDAEDVAQETFVRALRGLGGFDGTRPLRPWLLGIAANRCRTALGRRSRRPVPVETIEDCPEGRPAAPNAGDLAEELELALAHLRPEYRAVFALYHHQELAYDEIAEAIGRPIGTIKTWLHRARAEMAEFLASRGVRC